MISSSCVKPKETMKEAAFHIGNLAYRAMLEEVYTTPKPGLVDLYSTGAHKDMDVISFEKSAKALEPYFVSMALEGMRLPRMPRLLFERIRRIGLSAEEAMYQATAGVNTHKGLIFHLGILSAAAGACIETYGTVTTEYLVEMEQAMARETLIKELKEMQEFSSNGEKNLNQYGLTGARGEAISGYASVCRIALPVMAKGVKEGRDWNRIKLETLFMLMSRVEDSNIIARHDPSVLLKVQSIARNFLLAGGAYGDKSMVTLKRMDADFIKGNISAGGCADLLAVAIFMNDLAEEPVKGRLLWNS
ncbi:triphosphoribosyl-dephospho-CoA synthase CitG [Lacrimispora sphenoides]|uniref:Probable 2-(5''-triphosphoribosyl)-3'-dephosphocoenzyme-A synthase n=1 Tax=Lacrimispora sphenoides JCM 1415 TaxID=1297793 RepID=A0ABY1C3F8_9FIRM|nr:triphosphoribosyl-dephospho-CoA synthase CitG [Lacrimispora sphenoides]SET60486.1 triphosphoribosyl-dephospho-CoA synthase [[Clostridium] sphenoides JCM 1415]SUY50012.1 holo-ACP synthase CitX [Lacrimispora sphenoides]